MNTLDFYTQYSQFYVRDAESPQRTDSLSFWTDEAFRDRLAVEDGVLGVGTECYGPVKGTIIFRESENRNFDLSQYDHIVEASILINSGLIQVVDCPSSIVEFQMEIPKGNYRVRIYSINLASVVGDEGDDFYEIEIWPSEIMGRTVLKRYNRN